MFDPLNRKRTFELITDSIKQSFFSGQLKPGDKLPSERDLAFQMKVGRPVVREALRSLEASGLVTIKLGVDGGTFVCEPNSLILTRPIADLLRLRSVTVDHLTEAGLLFEKSILEIVMKSHCREDYNHLDEVMRQASRKIRRRERIAHENALFHTMLADMCHNPIVTSLMDAINRTIGAFTKPLNPPLLYEKRILEGHKAILFGMKEGNLDKAIEKYEEHLAFFSKELKRMARLRNVDLEQALHSA